MAAAPSSTAIILRNRHFYDAMLWSWQRNAFPVISTSSGETFFAPIAFLHFNLILKFACVALVDGWFIARRFGRRGQTKSADDIQRVVTLHIGDRNQWKIFSVSFIFCLNVLGFSLYTVVATMNATLATSPLVSAPRRPAVPNSILGVLIFIITEVMFFSGLISAYAISRTAAGKMLWPPPGQPRLPVETTGFNTAVLLLSAMILFLANRASRQDKPRAAKMLAVAMGLGGFFVLAQGREWAALITQGLMLTTSTHGSFFYVIVGCHAFHAVAAICALAWAWTRMRQDRLSHETLTAVSLFWYFVAGIWPMLYYQVYLS